MPLPKPNASESHSDFMSRCMLALEGEFPDAEQRRAVCMKQHEGEPMQSRTEHGTRNTDSAALVARSTPVELISDVLMWMPGGVHLIHAGFGNASAEVWVQVDRESAAVVQASFRDHLAKYAPQRAFFDREHEGKDATAWPTEFFWSESPKPGVYARAELTSLGRDLISGKVQRGFSPQFYTDAELPKRAQIKAGQNYEIPEGKRGSQSNPARITSIDFPAAGGFTNFPAFRNNLPLWAKHAGKPGAALPNKNTTAMTDQEKAALEARIQQTAVEIAELKAKDQTEATVAEALLAKENDLQLMNAQLTAKIAEDRAAAAERENLINRTQKAQELVAAAVKRGAIPTKNLALQASWTRAIIEDPANVERLDGIPSSLALTGSTQPSADTGFDRRRMVTPVLITRESNEKVLGELNRIYSQQLQPMRYQDKPAIAKEFAALYAKEIKPRMQLDKPPGVGDDIPLSAVDTIGTLTGTLVTTRSMELLLLGFPILDQIWTDFSAEIVDYKQTLKSRFFGVPAVQTFNESTGWPTQSERTTTDVSITYDQFKGVPMRFTGHEVAGTVRRLLDEFAPLQAYALGKSMVDYLYGLITSAYTQQLAAGLGTFGRSTVVDLAGLLDDAGVPDLKRFLILNRPYFSALSKDNSIIQLDAFQALQMIQKGLQLSQLRQVEGLQIIKAVNLPATVIGAGTLKGFAGSMSSLAIASRLSADYTQAAPGASNGLLTVISLPGGMSANLVQFVDHNGAYAAQRTEFIYGGSRAQLNAGAILRDV